MCNSGTAMTSSEFVHEYADFQVDMRPVVAPNNSAQKYTTCNTNCHRPAKTPDYNSKPVFTPCQQATLGTIIMGAFVGPWVPEAYAWYVYFGTNGAGALGAVMCF
jgi:hypothetical protein